MPEKRQDKKFTYNNNLVSQKLFFCYGSLLETK